VVRAFPDAVGRWQVSTGGGAEPYWTRDGQSILYRQADTLFAVSVQTRPSFGVGRRRVVLQGSFQTNENHTNYDRDPRTGQFAMLGQRENALTSLVVVLNWFEELKRRMSSNQ